MFSFSAEPALGNGVKSGLSDLCGRTGGYIDVLGFFTGESVNAEGCGGGKETVSLFGFFPKLAFGGDVLGWRTALSGERPLVQDGGGLKIMSCVEDISDDGFSSEKISKSP